MYEQRRAFDLREFLPAKLIVFSAKFLVFDTQFLVFKCKNHHFDSLDEFLLRLDVHLVERDGDGLITAGEHGCGALVAVITSTLSEASLLRSR